MSQPDDATPTPPPNAAGSASGKGGGEPRSNLAQRCAAVFALIACVASVYIAVTLAVRDRDRSHDPFQMPRVIEREAPVEETAGDAEATGGEADPPGSGRSEGDRSAGRTPYWTLTTRLESIDARLRALAEQQAALTRQQAELSERVMNDGGVSRSELDAAIDRATDEALDVVIETALLSAGLAQPGQAVDARQQRRIEFLLDAIRRFEGGFEIGDRRVSPERFMLWMAIRLRTHDELILTAEQFIRQLARRDEEGRNLAAVYPNDARRPLTQVLTEKLNEYDRR